MKLDKKKEQILKVLADECERNPRTSLTGLDMKLLGEKVGAYLGIGVMYDVSDLTYSGFVSKRGNRVIITQKGLAYVKPRRPQSKSKSIRPKNWIFLTLIISIIAGLIVAIITGWRPW